MALLDMGTLNTSGDINPDIMGNSLGLLNGTIGATPNLDSTVGPQGLNLGTGTLNTAGDPNSGKILGMTPQAWASFGTLMGKTGQALAKPGSINDRLGQLASEIGLTQLKASAAKKQQDSQMAFLKDLFSKRPDLSTSIHNGSGPTSAASAFDPSTSTPAGFGGSIFNPTTPYGGTQGNTGLESLGGGMKLNIPTF